MTRRPARSTLFPHTPLSRPDAPDSGGGGQPAAPRPGAAGAPRFGPARGLPKDREADLSRHYGIEYSTATSDSLLPAAEPEPTGPAPSGAEATVSEPAVPEPTEAAPTASEATESAPDAAVGQDRKSVV